MYTPMVDSSSQQHSSSSGRQRQQRSVGNLSAMPSTTGTWSLPRDSIDSLNMRIASQRSERFVVIRKSCVGESPPFHEIGK
eukprot:scaffold5466_cov108-Skeletonema_menzelii.AAC.5